MSKSAKPNGFTLVEMSATIVVIGIIGLGLTMTLCTTFLHYSTDFVRQEIRHYGNTVMRELNERISHAQKVDFDVFKQSTLTLGFFVDNILNTAYRDYLNRQRYFTDDLGRNFRIQLKLNY